MDREESKEKIIQIINDVKNKGVVVAGFFIAPLVNELVDQIIPEDDEEKKILI